jgi:dienelactone hydrolase
MRASSPALLLLSSLSLLAACAVQRAPDAGRTAARESATSAYVPAEQDMVTTTTQSWHLANEVVTIVLAEPSRSGLSPVVVYLPGLGETSAAGERWRTAWASAGYAVVSVQLLDDDATAWASPLAREGDFKALGRERYAAGPLNRRVQVLAALVAEMRRRAAAGDAPWQRLDWSRVAVAGFDVGAYTSMRVAGERVPGADAPIGGLDVRAVLALSPYAAVAAAVSDTRYGGMAGPVRTITSNADDDLLGLVDEPSRRELPFAQMPAPDKYLLVLRGLPHSALGGNPESKDSRSAAPKRRQSSNSSKSRRGAKGGDADDGVPDTGGESLGADIPVLSADVLQRRQGAAQTLSTAFLDAYVKRDGRAREWLASDLSGWLGASGELRRK